MGILSAERENILGVQLEWYRPLILYVQNPGFFPPAQFEEEIKNTRHKILARNLFIFKELKRILDAFNIAAVPAIVLKGPCLAETLYPPGVRPLGDIDLLIKQKDFSRAEKIISSLGYTLWEKGMPLWLYRDFAGKITYLKNKDCFLPLDLHISLGAYPYSGRVKTKCLWEKAVQKKVAGVDALILCPEHFLLHLCLHLFQHRHENWLTSSSDIALLIRHFGDEFNWPEFLKNVLAFKVHLPVGYSLKKTCELFGPLIPPFVFDRLDFFKTGKLEQKIFLYYLKKEKSKEKYLIQFLTRPGVLPKIRCLFNIFLPARSIILDLYPVARPKTIFYCYFLYYKDVIKVTLQFFATLWGRKKS